MQIDYERHVQVFCHPGAAAASLYQSSLEGNIHHPLIFLSCPSCLSCYFSFHVYRLRESNVIGMMDRIGEGLNVVKLSNGSPSRYSKAS